jgi:hypothetical protein
MSVCAKIDIGEACFCRAALFSKDFRKIVEAVETLIEQINSNPVAITSSMDLLLRWAALRLCDPHGNTTAILKVLELCREMFGLIARQVTVRQTCCDCAMALDVVCSSQAISMC